MVLVVKKKGMFHWIVFAIAAAASLLLQPQLASIYRHGDERKGRGSLRRMVRGLTACVGLASREEVVGYE
jgi:hypothetical protein